MSSAEVRLAGDTALAGETVETITHDLIRIGIAAFLVNFILLAIFLRALIAPLYLVLASALALAASIGLTTLFFQGFLGHEELTYYVPFAVAVLLLSLGSDYNVFVVGRIWQSAEGGLSLREAIATAAPSASRAIGVAGLALAFSFAALALIDLRQFHEFAFAMCVGVLLDAFVVRTRPDPGSDLPLRRAQLLASQTDARRAGAGHGHRHRLEPGERGCGASTGRRDALSPRCSGWQHACSAL